MNAMRVESLIERPSRAAEDYCKAIYNLSELDREPSDLSVSVSTSKIATQLNVSPGSVSSMLKQLRAQELIVHSPYRGASLTAAGERLALKTVRTHRLLESFLHDVLGMPWDQVHAEAEILEHFVSDRINELIAQKLGEPKFDPHGDPIPDRQGRVEIPRSRPLSSVEIGEAVTLIRVSDGDSQMLGYLAEHGIERGAELKVEAREPFEGSTYVSAGSAGSQITLPPRLADAMRVAA